jgi:hypothetical protein
MSLWSPKSCSQHCTNGAAIKSPIPLAIKAPIIKAFKYSHRVTVQDPFVASIVEAKPKANSVSDVSSYTTIQLSAFVETQPKAQFATVDAAFQTASISPNKSPICPPDCEPCSEGSD